MSNLFPEGRWGGQGALRAYAAGVVNRAAVAAVPAAELDVVGLGIHGPRNAVDKVVKGARMHP